MLKRDKFVALLTKVLVLFFFVVSINNSQANNNELMFFLQSEISPRQDNQLSHVELSSYLNSCEIQDDPLNLQLNIQSGIDLVGPCAPQRQPGPLSDLSAGLNEIRNHAIYSGIPEYDPRGTEMADLGLQAEFHALLQAGIARIKTLKVLKGIDLSESELRIEVSMLCSSSYGRDGCPEATKEVLTLELKEQQRALDQSISLGLERTYTVASAQTELTERFSKINQAWRKAHDLAKEHGANSIQASIAYTEYLEIFSLAASDPVGIMMFNAPFEQVPKPMTELASEELQYHEYRKEDGSPINIQSTDIEAGMARAVDQSISHLQKVTQCRNERETGKPQLHCLLERAPTAVGQALAFNPRLAGPGLCLAINKVSETFREAEENLGYLKAVTNFMDIVSVPLLFLGGSGLLLKGLTSLTSRLSTAGASRALAATSGRLGLSSVSMNLINTSGTIGVFSSGGRVVGGTYSALLHQSDYLTHTAAIQAAAQTSDPENLLRATQLRNQTIESFQDLKDGAFDFLPFGALMTLVRSERIARIGGRLADRLGRFDQIANGHARINQTLQLIKNHPQTERAFRVAMRSAELGSDAVTAMVAALATMNTNMKNKVMDHLERIKNDDNAIKRFFEKIKRNSVC